MPNADAFVRHMKAKDVNETWIGWRLRCTNRADAREVEGGLSDFQHFGGPVPTTHLFLGGNLVELRPDDLVTAGRLDVPGAA